MKQKKVVIYSKENCPYCTWAKQLLDKNHVTFQEIRVDVNEGEREKMERLSGRRTVPQIFIGEKHVGGYDDLKSLYDKGELDTWLAN